MANDYKYVSPITLLIVKELSALKDKTGIDSARYLLKKYPKNQELHTWQPDSLRRYIAKIKHDPSYYKQLVKAYEKYQEHLDEHPEIVITQDIKEKKLSTDVKELRKANQRLLDEIDLSHKKISFFEELSNATRRSIIIPPTRGIDSQATAFLIGSDWHLEERVDPATCNGLNEYNLDIAKDSVANFFSNGERLVQITQKDVHIDTIIVALVGDIINGYIHEEFLEDNLLSPTEASLMALDVICSGIEYLVKKSKCKIKVVCKYGNHGRTTQRMRVATAYKNSYEWMLFQLVIREFRDHERVEVVLDNSYLTYVDVYGYTIRFHHGDAIRYEGGVGGVTIPVNKAIAQWDKHKQAYLDVFGHFHQLQLDTGAFKYVLNGSIVGYNAYAIKIKAAYEEPRQAFFLIDSKRGKTISAPIFVRKKIH